MAYKIISTAWDLAEKVGLSGKSFLSVSELSKEQLLALFELARALEPIGRSSANFLNGKVMATFFYEPSTRTRLSTETAMRRLGGSVITEATPLLSSSAAKEESLHDTLRVLSKYADIIALRHSDYDLAMDAARTAAEVPVINCGFGNREHPTQGLLDIYTIWRMFGNLENVTVLVAAADMSRGRSGHSMAMGLAKFGAKIILASPKDLPTPREVVDILISSGGQVEEVFDCTTDMMTDLIAKADFVYLPGCRVPKGTDAREEFRKRNQPYYISLEQLEKARKNGHMTYVMHSLPRFAGEFDENIDKTEHELYFKQVQFGVFARMALILSMIGV
ncbi:aspartate/ornithine carbamoyltransferase family protein [Moorella sulfitireducens]|uniref:aspartate/ornithine carbamoyltransferase family protein n=1 Tax=Neomoorella sulfitireducens TaxID=2972948 RepID=UPI0021AD0017|nr:hypothetical protein [Moorella sulfitireducens]